MRDIEVVIGSQVEILQYENRLRKTVPQLRHEGSERITVGKEYMKRVTRKGFLAEWV